MALSERDCPHGRQLGKCADCDLSHMEMAAAAEARRVDELTALRKQDDALILQLVEAMEGVKALNMGGELALWTAEFDRLLSAITAGRARLAPPPPTA
ncbi:hypothetical protein [Acidovorax sp.]|uniref:hypothetical protein n=1 Tax=Acidovorax sp. TaxID=1872122 RepID=UPI0025C55628|nr:hypothetical protein [Acidovorax sp.]MBL7089936.1 hypothetical protein [Acidovorax sp.]